MNKIKLDYPKYLLDEYDLSIQNNKVKSIHEKIHNKDDSIRNFLGWLDYPLNYSKKEFEKVKEVAEKVRSDTDIFVVIGVGGSYLGAKGVIEGLSHSFYNLLSKEKRKYPEIIFIGNNFSSKYMNDFLDYIQDKDISINVISKSGDTLEVVIAFRIVREYMIKKYGKEANERIYITTDKTNGSLRALSNKENYQSFIVPSDIGGRYSVFCPVGLLPMAVSGIDIDMFISGARDAVEEYKVCNIEENNCYKYAIVRNYLYNKGKNIEVLISYESSLKYFTEWWKQLFGESEGKAGKGIFPTSMIFSTDLHSLGQYIQDGKKHLFETIINIEKPNYDIKIPYDTENIDKINFINGKSMNLINQMAFKGAYIAHEKGGVPCVIINIPEINSYYMGKLIYFFMKSCVMSGYLLDVNPFDQNGVDEYKKTMINLIRS